MMLAILICSFIRKKLLSFKFSGALQYSSSFPSGNFFLNQTAKTEYLSSTFHLHTAAFVHFWLFLDRKSIYRVTFTHKKETIWDNGLLVQVTLLGKLPTRNLGGRTALKIKSMMTPDENIPKWWTHKQEGTSTVSIFAIIKDLTIFKTSSVCGVDFQASIWCRESSL